MPTRQPTARTAVLVFAKSAGVDLGQRFGTLPPTVRRRLARGLEYQVRQQVRASGLPYVLSTERDQRGDTYGERLANACADALALGYERLVVVGGDCPGLRARHLREAAAALATGRAVVGRDLRGGVYLFGVDVARFRVSALAGLPYRSAVLAKALTDVLGGDTDVAELERLGDVHSLGDLRREWRRLCAVGLRHVVRNAVAACAKTRDAAAGATLGDGGVGTATAMRGPPAAA